MLSGRKHSLWDCSTHALLDLAWSPHEGMKSWPLGAAQEVDGHEYRETWEHITLIRKLLTSAGPQLPPL